MTNFNDKIDKAGNSTYPEFGKLPPQAVPVEEAILGTLLLEVDAIHKVNTILKPEYFYTDINKEIYKAIIELNQANKQADIITVTEQLRKNNKLEFIGGAFVLSELTNRIGMSLGIEEKAFILIQKYLLREVISKCGECTEIAYEYGTDALEMVETLQNKVIEITNIISEVSNDDNLDTQINNAIERLEKQIKGENTGVNTIYRDLAQKIFQYEKQCLYIVAARPGVGKTSIVITEILRNRDDLFISLDTSTNQIMFRMVSQLEQIKYWKLKKGILDQDEKKRVYDCLKFIKTLPIKIIDKVYNWNDLRIRIKNEFLKRKYKRIIIDYLQLIPGFNKKGENRNTELEKVVRDFKLLIKELDVPGILLSQLNREVEKRGGKRPQLSDLKDCGSIEQDSDCVIFIWRPEAFGMTQEQLPEDLKDSVDVRTYAEFDIAKNRDGALGRVPLTYLADQMEFKNYGEEIELKQYSEQNEQF